MTSNCANLPHVVLLGFPEMTLLDITGPAEVFGAAGDDHPLYRVTIASPGGGQVKSDRGVRLHSRPITDLDPAGIDTLLVPGGKGVFDAARSPALQAYLRRAVGRVRRLGATCTGAFVLAEAGLLDGRRAATHWRWCDRLKREYPQISVDADSIYVRDGNIWTSAGVTAGIDMSLAMVNLDHGRDTALDLARRLVLYLKREGGQSQFSEPLAAQSRDDAGSFDALHAWIRRRPARDTSIERLADYCTMSPRTFYRRYKSATGMTPRRAIEKIRVELARDLLEKGSGSIEQIAAAAGFGQAERMRRSFLRVLGVPPQQYRDRFGRPA